MTIDRCVDQGGRTKNLRDGPNCHRGLEENTSWVSLRVLHASSSIHSSDPTWTGGGHRHREIPPPSRTKWTRLVHPSVLTGHVSSLSCRTTTGGRPDAQSLGPGAAGDRRSGAATRGGAGLGAGAQARVVAQLRQRLAASRAALRGARGLAG